MPAGEVRLFCKMSDGVVIFFIVAVVVRADALFHGEFISIT